MARVERLGCITAAAGATAGAILLQPPPPPLELIKPSACSYMDAIDVQRHRKGCQMEPSQCGRVSLLLGAAGADLAAARLCTSTKL